MPRIITAESHADRTEYLALETGEAVVLLADQRDILFASEADAEIWLEECGLLAGMETNPGLLAHWQARPDGYRIGGLSDAQRQQIVALASASAQMFVDEFMEPLYSAQTDWDGVAWGEDRKEIPGYEDWENRQEEMAWELYRQTLECRTGEIIKRLS